MPKTTKNTKEVIEANISEEEYEEEVEETEEEVEVEDVAEPTKRKKMTQSDLFREIICRLNTIETAEAEFAEQQKEFDALHKEFNQTYRKNMRELSNYLKRFEKAYSASEAKKKPRKTENAGKGGFNKPLPVPEKLRNFIGIDESELHSRPAVTKLLNVKFDELGLAQVQEEDGKKTNIIKLDKKTAKALGRKEEIIFKKDIQKFIASFYHENDATTSS